MILHLDMDAFYAAVEQLDRPELRGCCVIVGGTAERGVVAAASYEARRCGVRSAMPMFQARRLCPQGVFVRPRMDRYQELSAAIMALLREVSPRVEPVSIDEAFVDLAGTERLHGAPRDAARRVKQRVREAVQLSCSVGVAPTRFLAKIASDMNKPDGLTVIHPEEVLDVIDRLPVEKVPGVGPRAFQKLRAMGVRFLGEVRAFPAEILAPVFGSHGSRLIELAHGIDATPVSPDTPAKSISSECTLAEDTHDRNQLARCLLAHADEVAAGLRREGVQARTVVLKLRHADFTLHTRRVTFSPPARSARDLYRRAIRLLEEHPSGQPIRLVGLGATGFVPADTPRQRELFAAAATPREDWETVDRTLEAIQNKFGPTAIGRAALAEDPGEPGSG